MCAAQATSSDEDLRTETWDDLPFVYSLDHTYSGNRGDRQDDKCFDNRTCAKTKTIE